MLWCSLRRNWRNWPLQADRVFTSWQRASFCVWRNNECDSRPSSIHISPIFLHPEKLSCYSEALHACQPTWRIRPLSVANTGSFFKQTERTGGDSAPIDLFPLHHPVRRSKAHHTSTAGGRQTMALCPVGGSRASLCLYCSTALGNLRTLDQTKAKMNSNVERLKNQFSWFFVSFARRATVCFKGLRPQWPTWQQLWSVKHGL